MIGGVLDVAAGLLDVLTEATEGAASGAKQRGGEEQETEVEGMCFHRLVAGLGGV